MNKLKVLVLCVCAVVFIFSLSVARADDAAEYAKRLSEFITYSNKQGITEAALKPYYNKLVNFSNEYPNSRFADDATYIVWMMEFISATMVQNIDLSYLNEQIRRMEKFVKKYPDGKIEDLTSTTAHKVLGEQSFGIILGLPYQYLVEFMEANKAFVMRDCRATVELYSSLKVKLEDVIKNNDSWAAEIYIPLWGCLRNQKKFAEEKQLYEEIFSQYPGTKLESRFREYQKKTEALGKQN